MTRFYQLEILPPGAPGYVPDDIFGQHFSEMITRLAMLARGIEQGGRIVLNPRELWPLIERDEVRLALCVDAAQRQWREVGAHEVATGYSRAEGEALLNGRGFAFGVEFKAARVRHIGWLPVAAACVIYPPFEQINSAEWATARIKRGRWQSAPMASGAGESAHLEGVAVSRVKLADPARFDVGDGGGKAVSRQASAQKRGTKKPTKSSYEAYDQKCVKEMRAMILEDGISRWKAAEIKAGDPNVEGKSPSSITRRLFEKYKKSYGLH